MKFGDFLGKLNQKINLKFSNILEEEIAGIHTDSRLVKHNSIFFALPAISKNNDGIKYAKSAIENGAKLVICSQEDRFESDFIPVIATNNISELLIKSLQVFYNQLPANIYAVTGTNGKTSVAEFTRQILEIIGKNSVSIGTLGVMANKNLTGIADNGLTTPDIASLYKNLAILKINEIDDVVIEVSSIGLEQNRVAGVNFCAGAFTNLTQDHLDYHKNMANYFDCKMILFKDLLPNGSKAILNADIVEFEQIQAICDAKSHQIISYGRNAVDFKLLAINSDANSQKVTFSFQDKDYEVNLSALGEFQAYNMLCALAIVHSRYDLNDKKLKEILPRFKEIKAASGRMERVIVLKNNAQVFIDFAHSPDALENVLKFARKLTKERVVVLFGCGGDRDNKKRPIMGNIACNLADLVIVTDDNPRTEDAQKIRNEVLSGCNLEKTIEISDRKIAIAEIVKVLKEDDLLIIAGKGHENYQIIGKEKLPFNEVKTVLEAVKQFNC